MTAKHLVGGSRIGIVGISIPLLCASWLGQGCGYIGLDSSQLDDGDVDVLDEKEKPKDELAAAGGATSEDELVDLGKEDLLGSGGSDLLGSGGALEECPAGQILTNDGCHSEVTCADNEVEGPSGDCYFFTEGPSNQEDARASCQERGESWDLAEVDSEEEYTFIVEHLLDDSWIGATYQAETDTWVWVRGGGSFSPGDGTAFDFGGRGRGSFSRGADELCLGLFSDGDQWIWDDVRCGLELGAVCRGAKEG